MQRICILSIIVLSILFCITATPFAMMLEGYLLPGEIISFVSVNTPHVLALLFALAASHILLKKDWKRITAPWRSFSWVEGIIAFTVSFGLLLVFTLFTELEFTSPEPGDVLLFLSLSLILVPLQTLSEEVLFRALPTLLVFGDGKDGRRIYKEVGAALLLGLLFFALHLANGEFDSGVDVRMLSLYYFLYGSLSTLLGLSRGGFEATWGMHTAINLFTAVVAGYSDSPYSTSPFFMYEGTPDPGVQVVELLIIFILVTIVLKSCSLEGKDR